jgi:DNA-directed RNA polymerase specialized sigma24 family protein
MDLNDKNYETLKEISYKIAMSMLRNHDDAEDTAHETILKYIIADDIENAEAWTKKVTQNLVYEKFRKQTKIGKINKKIINDVLLSDGESIQSKLDDLYKLDMEKIKKYLSSDERRIYKEFSTCSFNIKKYADKYNMSYDSARNKVKQLRHNLKAMYLRDHGYKMTSTLLLKEWNLIYAMIRRKFLNKEDSLFKMDKFTLFVYIKDKEFDNVLVVGTYQNNPVFFFIDGKMQRNKFKILNVRAPKSVRKLSPEEKIKILSDPEFNTII